MIHEVTDFIVVSSNLEPLYINLTELKISCGKKVFKDNQITTFEKLVSE